MRNLYAAKEVASVARPSRKMSTRAVADPIDVVKGDTTDASASDMARPQWASRSAPQSLPPSPVIEVMRPASRCICSTATYRERAGVLAAVVP